MVVGYAGTAYHAWVNVWSEETGWVTAAIYFDGTTWQRMDPTFASSSNSSDAIMKYIGDGSNYSVKYLYGGILFSGHKIWKKLFTNDPKWVKMDLRFLPQVHFLS